MKISYNWLQGYFGEKLPPPEKLAELITFGFAEVESAEKKGEDTILDIKVLPDRACYALSHRGIAYEVAAITGFQKKVVEYPQPPIYKVRSLSVRVEAPDLCPRYTARVIENVSQKAQPWVKEHLEAIGERSINPIVDGANIVMFDMGQPLHAFDADKVEGGIVVRRARHGEKITTLDNREVALDETMLVIADEKSPLAIAGIKGGKKPEVTAATKNLILESANFDASYVRKTSERLGIKTDASKRFENKLSPEMASAGMNDFTAFLFEMDRSASYGEVVDVYSNVPQNIGIEVTADYISGKLGLKISEGDILKVLKLLEIGVEKKGAKLMLTPPAFRVDLAIPEDIAEEVGRILGYDKIPSELPPKTKGAVTIPKSFYYEWKIRELLIGAGFSEVMTSSFGAKGEVAIEKPLAGDKKYTRPDLRGGFAAALRMNTLNAPLFGADETKIFEIGKIFPKAGECASLALGYAGPKKKAATAFSAILKTLEEKLVVTISGETKDGIFECNLDAIFEKLPLPKNWDISIPHAHSDKFTPFSPYPFIVRDISLFVGPQDLEDKVLQVMFEAAKKSAGKLLVRGPWLFDKFEKDAKISYAFRLVFQSHQKTLSDAEVNKIMEKVALALNAQKNWQVR